MSAAVATRTGRAAVIVAASWLCLTPAGAQSPAAQRGLFFVRTHCAQCHAIDRVSPSPITAAPPFRTLHRKYPVENLEEALAEGIVTGHPLMPEFHLDLGQVADVIAFFKSLEK
jgi:cytochrome c